MQFDPPRYEWTATTASEAINALQAARDLIDSHMRTLTPGNSLEVTRKARTSPTRLHLSLDLSGLVELINDQHTVKAMESSLSDLDLPDDLA
jgi:hypothetical protein